jgi:hypothetical protein
VLLQKLQRFRQYGLNRTVGRIHTCIRVITDRRDLAVRLAPGENTTTASALRPTLSIDVPILSVA